MKYFLSMLLLLSMAISQNTTLSGLGYYDYTYDLTENSTNDEGFALRRVYFTYKNNISEDLSIKFQTDVGEVGGDERLTAYLKKAQVDWKSSLGKITLGMQGMNMFNVTEKNWGLRFIEKSPMDKHGFSSSADMGIGYSGQFSNINYSVLMTNGSGYKKQENDKFKKISFHGVYGQPNLTKTTGYNIGLAYSLEAYEKEVNGNNESFNKTVLSTFIGYATNKFRIGGEFDIDTDTNGDIDRQIMAFYASYKVMDNFEGLVYVDKYDPNIDSDKDGETYIIAGFNYYATKGLIITPNIRMTSFESADIESTTIFKMNFQFKF